MNTLYQIEQLQKCYADPIYFINNYININHPTRGKILFEMYDYQKRLILHFENNPHTINCSSRQMGTTSTTAGYILWRALFKNHTILMGSSRRVQTLNIISIIKFAYDMLPEWLKLKTIENNNSRIVFDNGGKILIQSVNHNFGRGMSCDLVYLADAAYIPRKHLLDAWDSILPSIYNGNLILQSSGIVKDSLFEEWWKKSVEESIQLSPFLIKWNDMVNRDDNFKNATIAMLGIDAWNSQFELIA